MTHYFKAILNGIYISVFIIIIVYVHAMFSILPPMPNLIAGYQKTHIAEIYLNEFFEHYNNQEFDYIYDKMLDPESRKSTSRTEFKKYIGFVYNQYGKYLEKVNKNNFDFEAFNNIKCKLTSDKPIFYNSFDLYTSSGKQLYSYTFYSSYENGRMLNNFVFEETKGKNFLLASPFITKLIL